jgi:hypothetical protein
MGGARGTRTGKDGICRKYSSIFTFHSIKTSEEAQVLRLGLGGYLELSCQGELLMELKTVYNRTEPVLHLYEP